MLELGERGRGPLARVEQHRDDGTREPFAREREPAERRAGIVRELLPDALEDELIQHAVRAHEQCLRGRVVVHRSCIPDAHPRIAARSLADRLHHRRRPLPRLQLLPCDRDQLLARQRVEPELGDLLVPEVSSARGQEIVVRCALRILANVVGMGDDAEHRALAQGQQQPEQGVATVGIAALHVVETEHDRYVLRDAHDQIRGRLRGQIQCRRVVASAHTTVGSVPEQRRRGREDRAQLQRVAWVAALDRERQLFARACDEIVDHPADDPQRQRVRGRAAPPEGERSRALDHSTAERIDQP